MAQKSQVSIFLIISATIILALIGVFILMSANSRAPVSTSIVAANSNVPELIKPYIDNCMKNATHESLLVIGENGGYFNASGLQKGLYPNGYHYYNGIYLVPSDSTLQNELAKAFNFYFIDCLGYSDLPREIILKEEGTSNSEVSLDNSSVTFLMQYPMSVNIGGTITSFDSFSYTVDNLRLKLILDIARELTLQQMEEPDRVCLSCAADYATDNLLDIDLEFIDNNTVIYEFSDLNSNIDNQYYVFTMRHKHAE